MKTLITFALVALALSFTTPMVVAESESPLLIQEDVQLDRTKVRYGNVSKFDTEGTEVVGTIRSTEVYEQIPAYQTIQKEGLEPDSARYTKLIRQATKSYKAALEDVAKDKSFVLIVEEGGISGYAHVTDATPDIISAL
ncbi:MAG: hypothetical protein O3A95_00485 [Planctomycetota bacterium]|nr:hypothetical protein [Planctomycetota bacterium]MDA1112767.1 hypothetical protein [Planctomycetota bacterium]